MQTTVVGKHLDIGDTLRSYIEEALQVSVHKYFDRPISAHAIVSKVRDLFHVTITVNDGTTVGPLIVSRSSNKDAYSSVEGAVKKIETQLRRYKDRLRDHHKRGTDQADPVMQFTKYTVEAEYEDGPTDLEGSEPSDYENDNAAPTIIAERDVQVEVLSFNDAIMHMDLKHLPAYLFINKANRHLNLLYRREDQNISWIDTNLKV